jgi:diguanylate cyclase (GGDEF)-like protein
LELSLEQLEVIHSLLDAIDHLNDELAIANGKIDRLETLADEDVLVPMLNRRAFVRALVRLHSFGERYGFDTALLYFDLNSFKAINDDYGHGAGDAVLRSVGAFLCDNVRQSDVVGRLGGDEFAIVLPSATLALAERKGEELAAGIAQLEITYDGRILRTSAAFGAHALSAEEDVETALQSVDQAMYANKTRDR